MREGRGQGMQEAKGQNGETEFEREPFESKKGDLGRMRGKHEIKEGSRMRKGKRGGEKSVRSQK